MGADDAHDDAKGSKHLGNKRVAIPWTISSLVTKETKEGPGKSRHLATNQHLAVNQTSPLQILKKSPSIIVC